MSRMKEEKADLEKEHEDLLVMLTEQDNKIMKYKVILYVMQIHAQNQRIFKSESGSKLHIQERKGSLQEM